MKITIQWQRGAFYPIEEDFSAASKLPENSTFEVTLTQQGDLLSYKAVFWIWMRSMAKSFTERGREITDRGLHDILCHKFLGYTGERTIGTTVIQPSLRTLTYPEDLTTDQWYALLRQIEEWSNEIGVMLPANPSQYTIERERNG